MSQHDRRHAARASHFGDYETARFPHLRPLVISRRLMVSFARPRPASRCDAFMMRAAPLPPGCRRWFPKSRFEVCISGFGLLFQRQTFFMMDDGAEAAAAARLILAAWLAT